MLAVNYECCECGCKIPYASHLCASCKEMLRNEQAEYEQRIEAILQVDISCPECGRPEHSCCCGFFAAQDYEN
jgi:hypothetical protein